jgi:hypothetical protein
MSNPFLKLSYQIVLVLMLFFLSRPVFASALSDMDTSVRSIVSGIISYSRWPQAIQQPTLCIFGSSRYRNALSQKSDSLVSYRPVVIYSNQDVQTAGCDAVYFGHESPEQQVELQNTPHAKPLLFIAEQNAECRIGSAFCLIFNTDKVTFSVNLDALSRSGIRVNPDVLMLARNRKHG